MEKKSKVIAILLCIIMAFSLVGCGGNNKAASEGTSTSTDSNTEESKTQTTDEAATSAEKVTLKLAFHFDEEKIQPIIQEFISAHPEVEAIEYTNLSGMSDQQQITRLTGNDYEDVILIPSVLLSSELPNYFAPLGDAATIAEKYYYGDYLQKDGQTYGYPIGVVYEGLVYNKTVLDKYYGGVVPTTLDQLMECCAAIHENGVNCFYTNAGSTWPLRYWDNLAITMSEDPDYANKIVTTEEPWAEGQYLRKSDEILETMAKNGWLEPDVVTGDQWDSSLTSVAMGETAFLFTGTWALPQVKDAAEELGLDRDSIGFAPFPYKNDVSETNPLYLRIAQDLFLGVNKNSENLELSKEFCAFFAEKIALTLGMNEIMIDGGQNQPDLAFLQDLDYVKFYTSPARDPKISEMAAQCQVDVYAYDGFLLQYVILPAINEGAAQFDKLNELWKSNFK